MVPVDRAEAVERPGDEESAPDDVVQRHEPLVGLVHVVARVAGVVAVVAHHPERVLRHDDIERDGLRRALAGRQIQVGVSSIGVPLTVT
jgi:hypothetical protein